MWRKTSIELFCYLLSLDIVFKIIIKMNLVNSHGTMDSRVRRSIIHDWTNSHYATSITAIFFSIMTSSSSNNAMKNGELGNSILNQFLSIMYRRLGSGAWERRLATIARVHIYRCVFMYF